MFSGKLVKNKNPLNPIKKENYSFVLLNIKKFSYYVYVCAWQK